MHVNIMFVCTLPLLLSFLAIEVWSLLKAKFEVLSWYLQWGAEEEIET